MKLDVPRMVGRVHNRIKEGQARFEGLTPLFLCHPHRCGARHRREEDVVAGEEEKY
jgi:hypothetical protein